ncbi:MAG TPA: hypothetical protein VJR71_01370 [Pseudolabrys sp.]|nr:hypothetical protein [Pseudolabrys sp.]
MKMPVVPYFIVMGVVLMGLLILSDNYLTAGPSPFAGSQSIGISRPFKAEPERSPYSVTATNFAAAAEPQSSAASDAFDKSADKIAKSHSRVVTARRNEDRPVMRRVAQNPYDALIAIH